jgi:hypothetical protein
MHRGIGSITTVFLFFKLLFVHFNLIIDAKDMEFVRKINVIILKINCLHPIAFFHLTVAIPLPARLVEKDGTLHQGGINSEHRPN